MTGQERQNRNGFRKGKVDFQRQASPGDDPEEIVDQELRVAPSRQKATTSEGKADEEIESVVGFPSESSKTPDGSPRRRNEEDRIVVGFPSESSKSPNGSPRRRNEEDRIEDAANVNRDSIPGTIGVASWRERVEGVPGFCCLQPQSQRG